MLNQLPNPEIQPSWINIGGEDILQIGVPRRDINVGVLNRNESSMLAVAIEQLKITWIRHPDYLVDWVLKAIMLSENEVIGRSEIRAAITEIVGNEDDLDGLVYDTFTDIDSYERYQRSDEFGYAIEISVDWWIHSRLIVPDRKETEFGTSAKLTKIGRIVKELCFGTEMEVRVE